MSNTEKCRACGGKGTTPAPTIALALPPRERRELDQMAEDHPVTCYACGGTGKTPRLEQARKEG